MALHRTAATGFARGAGAYERTRPDYPAGALDWLADRLGLAPGRTVLDLAAGTGKLTRSLLATGARVVAVEPVAAMRERLPAEAESLDGSADAIPLPDASMDALTIAQAFHWFAGEPALAEMRRVLRPGGRAALIWNWRPSEDPLHAAIDRLLAPHRGNTPAGDEDTWREALRETEHFEVGETAEFSHSQELDAPGLGERVASTSFVAAMPDGPREQLLARVREVARDGTVTMRYRTEAILLIPG